MAATGQGIQVINPATGDFSDVARDSLVAQIDNQARAAIEAKVTSWLGEHGEGLPKNLPTFFGQVSVLSGGVQKLTTGNLANISGNICVARTSQTF